jgi:hypothetical protein
LSKSTFSGWGREEGKGGGEEMRGREEGKR